MPSISLRDVEPADIPILFANESDPDYCARAMIKPRTRAAFDAIWDKVFQDRASGATPPGVAAKVILLASPDGSQQVCGAIGCRLVDGTHYVGYGIAREYWGRGIASRALALLLPQIPTRPLHARAAATNAASIRILLKNGFTIKSTNPAPETDRYRACEGVGLVLA